MIRKSRIELKLKVDDKFIKEEVRKLHDKLWDYEKSCDDNCTRKIEIEKFIRSFIKELEKKIK